MMTIHRDWFEFLNALLSENTKFLLIALTPSLIYHVEGRLTEDIDVFIEPSTENAERVRAALERFGFGDVAPSLEELAQPNRVFMLGRKPWRIDILTGIDGVSFPQAWQGRDAADFHGLVVPIVGRTELLINKRASGRRKDLVNVALLEDAEEEPEAAVGLGERYS